MGVLQGPPLSRRHTILPQAACLRETREWPLPMAGRRTSRHSVLFSR